MGGGPKEATTTSTTTMPKEQTTNANMLLQSARDLFASGQLGPTPFMGQGYANLDPNQTIGRQLMTDFATSDAMRQAQDYVSQAQASNAYWLNPDLLAHPENMPGYQNSAADITNRLNQNLSENILPGINTEAIAAGGVGGSRQGVAQGLAVGRTSDAIGSSLGQLLSNNYNTLLQKNQGAVGMAPQLFQLAQASGLAPGQLLEMIGGTNRSFAQEGINDEIRKQREMDAQRIGNMQNFQTLTGPAGQYGGTNTTVAPVAGQSSTNAMLGGAMTGAGIGTKIMPGWGTAIGAIGGGLLGYMGS